MIGTRPLRRTANVNLSKLWYEKLTKLFIAIILWKSISVFDGYWWPETFLMARLTLLAAAAIEIVLPSGYRLLKSVLQAAATFLIIVTAATAYGDLVWQAAREGEWAWVTWLQAHASQISSFIWICLSLLALYVLFVGWATRRARIFGVLGAALLTLTIADSFTPIWLWDDVAWVVLTGLVWLVANHLFNFQVAHPGRWNELLRYPMQLFVPVAAVLAVMMTAGLLMPSIAPALQDPYTIWKQSKGETVQTFIGEKGSTPTTTNADSSSGYSRDDEALGGGFNYDYSPIMSVEASRRSYWRGETKNDYTGSGWTSPDNSDASIVRRGEELPEADARDLAETVEVTQTVKMLRPDPYPVLFAAAPASQVNWIDNPAASVGLPLLYWLPDDSELRVPGRRADRYPESYSLVSRVTILDEDALRKTKAGWDDPSRAVPYLQLPDSLPSRVRELAEQQTAAAANDYDKAKAIEQFLRLGFPYTNQPDLTKLTGDSEDFVDQFLFELQEGYCDYFSTAMAVMARSVGLPARWVKGFAPGTLPATPGMPGMPEEEMGALNPDGSGTYTVRNSDAHSWVEIYFDGFGWIPFEPTSGFSYPYSLPESPDTPIQPETLPDDETQSQPEASEGGGSINLRPIAWTCAALLAALGLVWLFVRRQAVARAWEKFRFRAYSANDRIVWETERLLRKCRRRGLVREEHETIREAVDRWSGSRRRLKGELNEVLDGFERAKYSPFLATTEEAEQFTRKVRGIIEQVR